MTSTAVSRGVLGDMFTMQDELSQQDRLFLKALLEWALKEA
jgi:hypothetical protein